MSYSRFRVLVKLLVTNQVCNVFKVVNFSNLLIPILVQNLLHSECAKGNTYARLLLEGYYIVDWCFHFFDFESRCKINCKPGRLNRVSSNVLILPLAKPNLESKKHMRAVYLDFPSDSQQTLEC